MGKVHANVVHIDELEPESREQGTRFGFSYRGLAANAGARDLGGSLYEVPPGRTAYPAHWHAATEEAIYILDGAATLRIGDDEVPVHAGHWLSFPVGPDTSHQLINTGDTTLRYLCISTIHPVEVVRYPDSGKVAMLAADRDATWPDRWIAKWFPEDSDVGYYDGEDTGE